MHLPKWKSIIVGMSAVALCTSPTGAIAATSTAFHPVPINPLVALSALGSPASRAALCGSSAAVAAATMAGQGVPGCLLPIVDAVPPPMPEAAVPPVLEPAPLAAAAPMTGLYAIPPVLLGMVGIVLGLVLLHALDDNNNQGDEDNSPA